MDKATKKAALQKLNLRNPIHFLALGFGTGKAPFMPGTFGTLAAFPLLISFIYLPIWGQIAVTFLVCTVGIFICDKASKDMGVHDHSAIVWDEVAGMMITMIAVPITLPHLIIGFILFRIFDIIKPWPISYLDRHVHGGFGIMIDDILAGCMALTVLQGLIHFNLLQF